ncbi:MMPL family transporter [Actinomadura violacea]|uniref:MMPL family transporter n=1 Tax=Actinomadura violacea TaxID=2819934 RepID=UPI0027DB7CA0|nr:MMPL family transporter [Actinomadura violacea]
MLYRVGRFCFRRRWWVAAVWAALFLLIGVLGARSPAAPPNDFSMPGTEAQHAYDLLDQRFPDLNADGATARVVFKAEDGKVTDAANRQAVDKAVGELGKEPQVARVTDPYRTGTVSKDGTTAYAQVSYTVSGTEMSDEARGALLDTVRHADSARLDVEVGGNAVSSPGGGHSAEALGLLVAAVVLVITFGALLAAGLPLLTALLGVGLGIGGIKALSGVLGLGSTTSALATMIGLAVGIDYALFVVSRYRGELAAGRDRREAAAHAAGTAGSAVVFAGLTVVIALAGLCVVDIPVLTQMGLAAAGTVALAVLIAVTLVPALFGIAGRRVGPARDRRRRGAGGSAKPALGVRWARFVLRRPAALLLAGVAVLAVLAVPVTSLKLGLSGDESKPTSTTQRRAYDMVAEGFGPGYNGPLTVVVQPDGSAGGDAGAVAQRLAGSIRDVRDVAAVKPPVVSPSGDTAVLTVIPASAPGSAATTDLVHALRAPGLARDDHARVLVSGSTAMNVDVSQKLADALPPYLSLVVGLAFVLLIAVFRSVLVPLKAALGFLLSVAAGLGAVVAVFQWGWLSGPLGVAEPGPVMSIMPIFLIGVVFGLAMDYEVFLVTRMREAYVHGRSPREAVVAGFEHGARVVTAAALIMISVFAAFLGSDEQMIKTMGFGLAAAVAVDAFVVRMTLVPAVLALLGDRAWWLPRWMRRSVPDLDVEGARLTGPPERPADGPAPADAGGAQVTAPARNS